MYRSSPLRSTLNTGYIKVRTFVRVCTEAVHCVALGLWKQKNVKTLPRFSGRRQKLDGRVPHVFLPFVRWRENSHALTLTREALEALGHEFLMNLMNQETSGCNLIKGKWSWNLSTLDPGLPKTCSGLVFWTGFFLGPNTYKLKVWFWKTRVQPTS